MIGPFKNHPRGLAILFFSELWERFSFYGMRSLLVLYMTKQMLYGDQAAYGVYAAYGALVYAFPVMGGFLADRILGHRNSVVLGGLLMALGHFCMAISHPVFFYLALGLLCVGNGFFKPNISSLVGKLYPVGDSRRDSGFTLFYMGINTGAFLAPIVCGVVGERVGWHYGFGLAGIGMLLGLFAFIKGQRLLESHGLAPSKPVSSRISQSAIQKAVIVGSVLIVPVVALALLHNSTIGGVLTFVGALVLAWLFYTAFTSEKVVRDRLLVVIVLMFFHMTFWAFFEQAGSSLTLFADRNVARTFLGFEITASMTQSLNPLFIILLAPVFAMVWARLDAKGLQPGIPVKFALALIQVGLGFGALVLGSQFAGPDGVCALGWLVLAYLLHTTGELCISPVGLSAVTKLAPEHVVGTVMGGWFLTFSFAHHIAGMIAKLTGGGGGDSGSASAALTPLEQLATYTSVFQHILWVSLGVGLFLLVVSPLFKRAMHGVK